MALLSVGSVSKSFGENLLFSNVSFSVGEKDKIGLIGSNGTGKTTLFKILAGFEEADNGTVARSSSLSVGYMEQYALKNSQTTLYEEALSVFETLRCLDAQHKEVTDKIALGLDMPEYIEKQHELARKFEELGGLTYESRTRAVLLGLGFSESDLSLSVSALSGGEKTRASLAKLLLSEHSLLLLDEPTNHLDMNAISYLEDFLRGFGGAAVIISHDRYFLDRVTTKTFDLENKRLTVFDGNYSVYHDYKEKNLSVMQKHYDNEMKEVHRLEGIIKQQRQWNREKNIKTAESKQKMLDKKLATLEKPETENSHIYMDFSSARRSGNDVLFVDGLSKAYDGKTLFKNVSMNIHSGDTVFLLGGNGTGKSTVLNILNNREKADSGEVRFGVKLDIAYYEQHFSDLSEGNTVISEIRNEYPRMTDTEIRNMLAGFLFFGDDVFKEISVLSGGERARLALLKMMLQKPNFLFLDEPTNHLDIDSCEALESALLSYDGTALIVSHDRYFINKLASKIYTLSENGTTEYDGNYDYYMEKSAQTAAPVRATVSVRSNDYQKEKQERSKLRKLQRALEKTEEDIAAAEEKLANLRHELENTGADYLAAAKLTEEISELEKNLETLYEDWEKYSTDMQ